jgi:hypothetical protein
LNRNGRVVYEDVEPAKRAHDLPDETFRLSRIALIRLKRRRLHALGGDSLRHRLRLLPGGNIADRDRASLCRQSFGNRSPKSPGPSRDQRDLALQSSVIHI